jgi:hypothetical protein
MSINFEVHNVTCLHIEEARVSTRIGQQTESDRQQWRNMTVTQQMAERSVCASMGAGRMTTCFHWS